MSPITPTCRFEAIVFDWDGTAVPDRGADATELRVLVEQLCAAGMDLAIVSGTHVDNVDGQLDARPRGPGRLLLALNRGSEVFAVDASGPRIVDRRTATAAEDEALDAAAEAIVEKLATRGLETKVVSQRLNRRKIDLIPVAEWSDPPKARIGELVDAVEHRLHDNGIAGLPEVVGLATAVAREAGLADPRVTSDAKHVEVGLTDKSDSANWIFADLWRRGIGPSLVLVGGDEFGALGGIQGSDAFMLVGAARDATAISVGREPSGTPPGVQHIGGGSRAFVEMLRHQLSLRAVLEPPRVDERPGWCIIVDGVDQERERAHEAMLVLSDGRVASNGPPLLSHPTAAPHVFASGVYDGEGPDTQLLEGPRWQSLAPRLPADAQVRRVLDLHSGLLGEHLTAANSASRSVRFQALGESSTGVLRAVLRDVPPSTPLVAPDATAMDRGTTGDRVWMRTQGSSGGIVLAAAEQTALDESGTLRLDRIVAFDASPDSVPPPESALATVTDRLDTGFEALLVQHRCAWARRWETSDILIEGDDDFQRAVRFALFHLQGAAPDTGTAAVGARGLAGPAYGGHVFWDADVFVLPFLAATRPAAARAMLEYRVQRLPAARRAALAQGRAGARFPWESARTGDDVTPGSARDRDGHLVPIRTGQLEDHVVADIAWATAWYLDWTGDAEFAAGGGAELLSDAARYWASRIRVDADGSAHIRGVIGPDEYHELVDDNAFTNVMARWNLRRAAELECRSDERVRWLELADALVDGYDPETGVYEQFAGFFALEPLIIEDVAPRRPVVADLLLGRERVRSAQVVKQADVLMLHHLVPDEVEAGSLDPNLRFYEPRTAHGSSLSPGIHAALFARARDDVRALEALSIAANIDLDDLAGTTAGGLHLAAMGTVWQALALGYAGLRPGRDGTLRLDPRLPAAWGAFEIRVVCRGHPVTMRKERSSAIVCSDGAVDIRIGRHTIRPGERGIRLRRAHSDWEVEA